MPLFACSKCETVENTATGHFWFNQLKGLPVLCSECGEAGVWHGKFRQRKADATCFVNAAGYSEAAKAETVADRMAGAAQGGYSAPPGPKPAPPKTGSGVIPPAPQLSGEACTNCGNFALVRSGTCMTCQTCGTTSGCS